jgi:hypothetical protein
MIPQPPHSLINLTIDINRGWFRHHPAIHPQPALLRLGHSAEFGKTGDIQGFPLPPAAPYTCPVA